MPKSSIVLAPLAAALAFSLAPAHGESDRHITYVQQHNKLLQLDREDAEEVQSAAQQAPNGEAFNQGVAIGKIAAALALNERLADFDITPQLIRGEVILTGRVEAQFDKQLAHDVALAIEGIEQVNNRIRVASSGGVSAASGENPARSTGLKQKIDMATAAASVREALSADPELRDLDIEVVASSQGVILDGTVQTQQQKDRLQAIANRRAGVEVRRNRVSVTP